MPTTKITLGRERSIICKMVIESFRAWNRAYAGSDELGDRTPGLMIGAAILIGQVEGRLMTASDIAAYIGMPRATVIHKLRKLEESGLIIMRRDGNRSPIYLAHPNNPQVIAEVRKLLKTLHRLCDQLSKLDSEAIADHRGNR